MGGKKKWPNGRGKRKKKKRERKIKGNPK